MSNDIITIDTVATAANGKKYVYHDTTGKKWTSWADKIVLVEKKTYEIQEFKPNQWSPQNAPEKKFTDYVITKAKEVEPRVRESYAHEPVALDKQTNGHAAPSNSDKERAILRAVLAKFVAPIPFSDRMTMANQMTEIYLAAQDACDRIVE